MGSHTQRATAPNLAASVTVVTLDVGGKPSQGTALWFPVTCCTTKNYLVTTNCSKGTIYVFRHTNTIATDDIAWGRTMFTRHESRVHDMAHLLGDIVVSVDKLGKAYLWNAETFEILDTFEAPDYRRLLYVHKMGSDAFVMAATSIRTGNVAHMLYVCTHDNGRNMKIVQESKLSPGGVVFGAHERNLYVKTTVKAFKYNVDSMKKLSFSNPPIASSYNFEFFAAASPHYIVLSYWNQSMFIYRNNDDCTHVRTLELSAFCEPAPPVDLTGDDNGSDGNESLRAITIISADLLMVTTQKFGIYFITPTGEVVARINVTVSNDLRNACVLVDGRICIVGADAYCGIWPCPAEVKLAVLKYARNNVGEIENGLAAAVNGIAEEPSQADMGAAIMGKDSLQVAARVEERQVQPYGVAISVSAEKPKLLQLKARHSMELERLERKLSAQNIRHEADKAEHRADKAKHGVEICNFQKEIQVHRRENDALRKKLAVCEVKLAVIDSEKEKLSKQLANRINIPQQQRRNTVIGIGNDDTTVQEPVSRAREHELQRKLDAEREKGRKYQTEKDIEAVQIKAQLDVQQIQIKSYKEELEWQKKKTEKAEAELTRIRAMENSNTNYVHNNKNPPPPKKRKMLNSQNNT